MAAKLTLIEQERTSQPQTVCRLAGKYAKAFTVYNSATPMINLATGKNLNAVGTPLFGSAASGREVHGVYGTLGHLQVRSDINPSVENWPGATTLFHGVLTTFAAGTYPALISIVPDTNYYNGIINFVTEPTNAIAFYVGASSTPLSRSYTSDFIGVPVTVIATYDVGSATRSIHIYANGRYLTNSGSISTTWPNSTSLESIGGYNRSGTYRSSTHAISLACVFPFSMGNAEILNLLKNPWQIFEPEQSPLFVPVAGGTTHPTSGDVVGNTATVTGSALREAGAQTHPSTGDVVGNTATVSGTALRYRAHPTTGVVAGLTSNVTGTALRYRLHTTTGAVTGLTSTVTGSATIQPAPGIHVTSGDVVAGVGTVTGSALHIGVHPTTGVLAGFSAEVIGTAQRSGAVIVHSTSGVLAGYDSVVTGAATNQGSMTLTPADIQAIVAAIKAEIMPVNIVRVNNIDVDGTGADSDPWGPV
jgi:hypothetical protein